MLALWPIYHQTPHRVRAHIFVAALALLLQCLLERTLHEADVNLSAAQAMEAAATIQYVTFRVNDEQRSCSGRRALVPGKSRVPWTSPTCVHQRRRRPAGTG